MSLIRKCRSCGARSLMNSLASPCPDCGEAYGPLTVGMDVDPGEIKRGLRDRQGDIDRRFNERMEEGRRDDIRRAVYGETTPSADD